ncbi:MAG: DUF5915 domain-containing protein, partial [Lachnospiraceae bacterium]|nr:DUF5915 domain-containing protein [Lachnospiraceae bacterium]
PIGEMYGKAPSVRDQLYTDIIADALNIKEVKFTEEVSAFTTYTFKPQLRTVGPKYGRQLGGIQKYLTSLDGNAAYGQLKNEGALKFMVNDVEVVLTEDDLLIDTRQQEGYAIEADNTVTVALNTNLTEALIEEGNVNEIISKIQTMRKDAGFEVMDHIRVSLNGNAALSAVIEKNKDAVAGKVLAEQIGTDQEFAIAKEWNINGEKVVISMEKC